MARSSSHAGVDFGENHGAHVLAAADGYVYRVINWPPGCGNGVMIRHNLTSAKASEYTVYCHMARVDVSAGRSVKRGDTIGLVGFTGNAFGVPHVHFELSRMPRSHADGDLEGTEDPLNIMVGCFDPQKSYPTDRLVLTYPVACKD